MTPNEVRYQMALLDGYPASCNINIESAPVYGADGDVYDASSLIPDYLNDLNAVARIVEKLSPDHWRKYRANIIRACTDSEFEIDPIDATAAQRCEAILRACGKWVEA